MLKRGQLLMCGKGALGTPCWEPPHSGPGRSPEGACHPVKPRRGASSAGHGGHPKRLGRHPRFSRTHCRRHYQQQQLQQSKAWPRCYRPRRPRVLLSLRPVNLMGKRAPGMRAPRNTNQFLMGEKYQLMHLRSDSVGTESGGSDCEMDPLDMDSYLGVLENARGALLDCPAAEGAPPPRALPAADRPTQAPPGLHFPGSLQEESLQYFPSEDDVVKSETFMERDFLEFCSSIA